MGCHRQVDFTLFGNEADVNWEVDDMVQHEVVLTFTLPGKCPLQVILSRDGNYAIRGMAGWAAEGGWIVRVVWVLGLQAALTLVVCLARKRMTSP